MDRARALDLLRDQHRFPGPFAFRVIVEAERRADVVAVVKAALGEGEHLQDVRERPSRAGRWSALQLVTELSGPETVLEVYALLNEIEGVKMTL